MSTSKIGSPEFLKEARKLGLNGYQYAQKLIQEGILPNPTNIHRQDNEETAKNKGFDSYKEYKRDYNRELRWFLGTQSPMSENEDCSAYLGIHVVERVLSNIFEDPIRAPLNNPGFDFVCKRGFKIDYKSSCLRHYIMNPGWEGWKFEIKYNNITDYYILVAFDNREDLSPMHIWLIHKDDIIRERKFWRRDSISITNKPYNLEEFKTYEVTDKLERLKECCDTLKK